MVTRRTFIKTGAGLFLASSLPCLADSNYAPEGVDIIQDEDLDYAPIHGQPQTLWIRRGRDEALLNVYTDDGYKQLAWLARDIRAGNLVGTPSPRVVRLAVWMQAWLTAQGVRKPLILMSGLRTPKTNNSTEGAARASKHLPDKSGMFYALDFEVAGVPSSYLAKLAVWAHEGGVGYYGDAGHIHIDDGRPRFWVGKKADAVQTNLNKGSVS